MKMVTKSDMRALAACPDGYRWFMRRFKGGPASLQEVLDAVAVGSPHQYYFAGWFINQLLPDPDAVMELEELKTPNNVFCAGRLIVHGDAEIGGRVLTGFGASIGGNLTVGVKADFYGELFVGGSARSAGKISAVENVRVGKDVEVGTYLQSLWGNIAVTGNVVAPDGIEAGREIMVGGDVRAHRPMRAQSVRVRGEVRPPFPPHLTQSRWGDDD